jgi:hypothetical protein
MTGSFPLSFGFPFDTGSTGRSSSGRPFFFVCTLPMPAGSPPSPFRLAVFDLFIEKIPKKLIFGFEIRFSVLY